MTMEIVSTFMPMLVCVGHTISNIGDICNGIDKMLQAKSLRYKSKYIYVFICVYMGVIMTKSCGMWCCELI